MAAAVPQRDGESGHLYFGQSGHFYLGTTGERRTIALMLTTPTPEGGHWVVVIGFEYDEDGVRRFMLLDPSEPEPDVCAWNGLIEARGTGGRYPYAWWSDEERKARLEHALAVWRR